MSDEDKTLKLEEVLQCASATLGLMTPANIWTTSQKWAEQLNALNKEMPGQVGNALFAKVRENQSYLSVDEVNAILQAIATDVLAGAIASWFQLGFTTLRASIRACLGAGGFATTDTIGSA